MLLSKGSLTGVTPLMVEYPSYFYINGKKYNKDLTMTSYDTMFIRSSLQTNFDSVCRFRLGLLGMVSEHDTTYNTGLYAYNVGSKSISDNSFTYVITSTHTNNVLNVRTIDKNGDLVGSFDATLSLTNSTHQHNIEILGQDDYFIYVSTSFGTAATPTGVNTYFMTLAKTQTAATFVSFGTTSSLVSSYYSKAIIEDENKIIVCRDGIGDFYLINKAINGSSRPTTSRMTSIREENLSFATCRNFSFGCQNTYYSSIVYSIAHRTEDGVNSHIVHKREVTNEGMVINDHECVLNNGSFIDVFKDQVKKSLVAYRTYVKHMHGEDFLIVVSSGIKVINNDNTNSITVFKIESDGSLTYTGTTVTPINSGSDIISRDGFRIIVSSSFGVHIYKFDPFLRKYTESRKVNLNVASFGFDLEDRLFLASTDASLIYEGDIANYTVTSEIILDDDNYHGEDVNGVIRVDAYDDKGVRGEVNVILSLAGDVQFLDGSNRAEVFTKTDSSVDVSIVAFGSGLITVNTSVEVVFE